MRLANNPHYLDIDQPAVYNIYTVLIFGISMNGRFSSQKSCLKVQALLSFLLSLGILIILVPEPSRAATSISLPISLSPLSHNYALLPVPFTVRDNLCRANLNKNEAYGKGASAQDNVAFLWTYSSSISSPRPILDGTSRLDSIFGGALQQACQLLDIPPPLDTVSL